MKPDQSCPKRSIAKAISWETISTLVTWAIAYPFMGSASLSGQFAAFCLVIKLCLFYYHERAWHQVSWGKSLD
jgi:uncharacterized membrane protein